MYKVERVISVKKGEKVDFEELEKNTSREFVTELKNAIGPATYKISKFTERSLNDLADTKFYSLLAVSCSGNFVIITASFHSKYNKHFINRVDSFEIKDLGVKILDV